MKTIKSRIKFCIKSLGLLMVLGLCFFHNSCRGAERIKGPNSIPVKKIEVHKNKVLFSESTHRKELKIAVYEEAPFVFWSKESGKYVGLSIDVWESIAAERGLSFKYIPVTKEEGLKGISESQYDIFMGAIPALIQEGDLHFYCTLPFYVCGLSYAIPRESIFTIFLNYFVSWNFFKAVIFVALFVMCQAFTVWIFEHGHNPQYPKEFKGGMGSALWWSSGVSSMVGMGQIYTQTLKGRVTATVWMFLSVIMITIFTGSISSELTVGKLSSHAGGIKYIKDSDLISIDKTAAQEYLSKNYIASTGVKTLEEGLILLEKRGQGALIHGEPSLRYEVNKNLLSEKVRIVPIGIMNQYYGFLIPFGSDLLYPLNQEILALLDSPRLKNILFRYLGKVWEI